MNRAGRNTLTIAVIILIAGVAIAATIRFFQNHASKADEANPIGEEQVQATGAKEDLSLSIDKLVAQEKATMLDSARRAHSHVEMWEVMTSARESLAASATEYQGKIKHLLKGVAGDAYTAERLAFSKWYDYQEVMASEVVTEIWQLYIGGTAGGDMYEMHLYDKAVTDYAEQWILYCVLTQEASVGTYQGSVSMEQILSEKERLINGLQSAYSMIDNDDNWMGLRHNAKELDGYISKDLALFQKWMTTRNALEPLLEPDERTVYASHTGFWMDFYYQCLKGEYIKNHQE